jgi:hypothetical protein
VSVVPEVAASLKTPKCQSAELVEVLALTASPTSVRSSEPVECHSATVDASKSISYAKLCQVSSAQSKVFWLVPPTYQANWSPAPEPYFNSVKWLSLVFTMSAPT